MTTERDEELMAADGVTATDYDDLLNGSDEVDDDGDEGNEDAAGGAADAAGGDDADPVSAGSADAGPAADAGAPAVDAALDEEVAPSLPAVEPVADLDGKLAAIDTSVEALGERFADAELSQADYNTELKKLQESRDALIRQAARSDLAAEAADRAWIETCNRFWAATKTSEGVDYLGSPALMSAIDAEVKRLAADPTNAQQTAGFFLRQAHANIKQAFGIKDTSAPAAKQEAAKPAAKPNRAPDLKGIPPNLNRIPPAGTDAPGATKWDAIDALPAAKREAAIARMSEAELNDYMDSF